jgi:transglutaminase-like putative cysteine protease
MPSAASAEGAPVKYQIVHTTTYSYSESVSVSHHLARLVPRTLPRQTRAVHDLLVDPLPEVTTDHLDYFGNPMTFFILQSAHKRLAVRARSVVELNGVSPPFVEASPPWERATDKTAMPFDAVECALDSTPARLRTALAAYARPFFTQGRPLLEAVADLTSRIHADFTYDRSATTIATPLAEVWDAKRGVCQDFARLEIACLRALGLAARYVSGYLETVPPPGVPRLVGADASHAWLAVHGPEIGWVDVDPTNNLFPSDRHITLGWGRDYGDVSPIRGVILGGGEHSLTVSVDVTRLDDDHTTGTHVGSA